ncbi:hypothetical protein [Streptomyces sp. NPDC056291]|uniref:hypothetical protein n=1 Tax=Streptomyces sp. NPDC056291 TaxID=3345772 RepID=UPI0035DBDF12
MKYIDRDGDTWADIEGGKLRIVASETSYRIGLEEERAEVEALWGPLRPVGAPDTVTSRAIRAELAVVLKEMADEAHDNYRWADGAEASMHYRMYAAFDSKARALRAEVGA